MITEEAKEQATEFTDKFMNANYTDIGIHGAKQCALIAQERIINILTELQDHVNEESSDIIQHQIIEETTVKTLINNL